ncbi:hypothetical protein LSTR_LSTR000948 [Laodelphax striatellus]|uniref:C2H2-type domain-containing protein n=1 Tax=Laodelphax striatellus TaxID=195883 RepID=A0A482X0P2_LAOST|nr:hypothetical protein LSTR_LSTR000948 [Laodelphax striatellus]
MKGKHIDDEITEQICNGSNQDPEPEAWLSSEEELDDEESSVTSLSSCDSSGSSQFGGFSVEEGGVPLQSAYVSKTWAQCYKCKEIFGSQAECLLHSAVCGVAALKCCLCEFKTRDKDVLERHHEETHTENSLQKDVKKRGRKPNRKLVRFPCPKCKRTFKYDRLLDYHLRKECGRPPRFDCSRCGYRCNQKSKMRLHQENVHNQLSASFVQLQRPAFIAATAAAVTPPAAMVTTTQEKRAEVDTINNNNQSSTCPSTPIPFSE